MMLVGAVGGVDQVVWNVDGCSGVDDGGWCVRGGGRVARPVAGRGLPSGGEGDGAASWSVVVEGNLGWQRVRPGVCGLPLICPGSRRGAERDRSAPGRAGIGHGKLSSCCRYSGPGDLKATDPDSVAAAK